MSTTNVLSLLQKWWNRLEIEHGGADPAGRTANHEILTSEDAEFESNQKIGVGARRGGSCPAPPLEIQISREGHLVVWGAALGTRFLGHLSNTGD